MVNRKIMDSLFFMGFLHFLGLFNDDIKINSWTKVISAVILHPPISFIFSGFGGSGQFDNEGLAVTWLCELIRCLNYDVISFYLSAGYVGQESEGVALIPCASPSISYFPGFGELFICFDNGSIGQILTDKEPI